MHIHVVSRCPKIKKMTSMTQGGKSNFEAKTNLHPCPVNPDHIFKRTLHVPEIAEIVRVVSKTDKAKIHEKSFISSFLTFDFRHAWDAFFLDTDGFLGSKNSVKILKSSRQILGMNWYDVRGGRRYEV